MSNILYISCHSVLEYDELRLLTSLGHSIFSIGSYFDPQNPAEQIRPPLKLHQDPKWKEIYYKTGCKENPAILSKEFLAQFDIIIAMHGHKFFEDNLKRIDSRTKKYWRGIGQSSPEIENRLKLLRANGIKLIRYSPLESKMANYAGEDYMIYFYKDEEDFKKYRQLKRNGKGFLCYNSILQRSRFNDWNLAKKFIEENGYDVYGRSNETIKNYKGFLSYEDQLKAYGTYSSVFSMKSYPAPYTLGFVEAIMSGCAVFMSLPLQQQFDSVSLLSEKSTVTCENIFSFSAIDSLKLLFSKYKVKIAWNAIL